MDVQNLLNGRVSVNYGEPVPYQSPLWIVSESKTEITYAAEYQGTPIAKIYLKDNEWYLATAYLRHWQPFQVFSKYEGYLLLLNLHKNNVR